MWLHIPVIKHANKISSTNLIKQEKRSISEHLIQTLGKGVAAWQVARLASSLNPTQSLKSDQV